MATMRVPGRGQIIPSNEVILDAANPRRRSRVEMLGHPSKRFHACQQMPNIRKPLENTLVIFVTPWMRSW